MKSKSVLKNIFITAALILPILFTSCGKEKTTVAFNSTINLEVVPTGEKYVKEKTLVHFDGGSNEKIGVLLGYGFNQEQTSQQIIKELKDNFGLAEDGGLIVPVVFPDDLHGRIYNLKSYFSDYQIKGLILLGSPENTHLAVGSIEDQYKDEACFNVFSYFPQDDWLGQEGISIFVLEEERTEEDEEDNAEVDVNFEDSYNKMILTSVSFMNNLPCSLQQNQNLSSYVKYCIKRNNLARYVDSQTGLQSLNHFIIPKGKNRRR